MKITCLEIVTKGIINYYLYTEEYIWQEYTTVYAQYIEDGTDSIYRVNKSIQSNKKHTNTCVATSSTLSIGEHVSSVSKSTSWTKDVPTR